MHLPTIICSLVDRENLHRELQSGHDAVPPTPVDNRITESKHWDDMLVKKIDSTGVAHAIPRRDLDTSGNTTYDMYRPDYSASYCKL